MRFGLHSLLRRSFGWRARSQGLDSSGRPAEDPDGRHGPDGPKGGAAHDGFDGQTKQGAIVTVTLWLPRVWAHPGTSSQPCSVSKVVSARGVFCHWAARLINLSEQVLCGFWE